MYQPKDVDRISDEDWEAFKKRATRPSSPSNKAAKKMHKTAFAQLSATEYLIEVTPAHNAIIVTMFGANFRNGISVNFCFESSNLSFKFLILSIPSILFSHSFRSFLFFSREICQNRFTGNHCLPDTNQRFNVCWQINI